MKIFIVFILILLGFGIKGISQEIIETRVKSDIKKVTVFITGGEVHRTAKVNIKKGRNKLVFTRISTVVDNKSVQFNSDKAFKLVSVSSEIDYLSTVVNNPRIRELRDTMKIIELEIGELQNEKVAYMDEKNLLQKNNSIKGTQKNLSVDELKAMAEYYRNRMMELNKTISDYDKKINKLNGKKYQYQNQLAELNYKETVKSNQIIVIIDSDETTTMNVNLKYIVSNCGWQANYDIATADVNDKIHLTYKAKVFNNTGNDWNDVEMVLSTSDPNLSASAPVLSPWYLNYESFGGGDYTKGKSYVVPSNRAYSQYYQNASVPEISQNLDGLLLEGQGDFGWDMGGQQGWQQSQVNFTTIEVPQLSTEFAIEKKYTIPSDSKPYLVEITEHHLDATFSHKAVPKLDKDAFLLANIVGWEKLDLVPGPTHVYFADTYVGQSYINTRNVDDTLRLSFGRDKKILINRKLLEEFSNKKVVGSNRKDSYTYEITIKNNRSIPVKMNLFDQVPISQDSDISVTIDEISGAEHEETSGKLLWKVNVAPGETVKYKLGFTIKYPKDKKITVQKYRKVYAPKF